MKFKIYILFLAVFLQSCAKPLVKQHDSLNSKTVCCDDLSELPYLEFHPTKKNKFKIDSESPAFRFGETKSYFSAFELPDFEGKYFEAKSYFNGMMIGQYFDPIFMTLDKNHRVLEVFSLNLRFVNSNLFGEQNANMKGLFKISPDSKYMVVFTAQFEEGDNYANIPPTMISYNVGNNVYYMPGSGANIKLERSPTGKLMLRLKEIE
ncbi:hypothetical protein [Marinicella rhabdoformis]|uniref:hypothetical protein n=1 Tax=Marinicella rhabdoformis TaxID=2580566 RepID=UPI0012AED36B|nr:hypothetical protein [Marinicella rhabdoformis]